jgi:CRP-like cAMP-binding protein
MDASGVDGNESGEAVGGPFWTLLSTAERAAFEQSGVVRRFGSGAVIVHEGDHSDHVLVVRAGCVKVVASVRGGGEFVLGLRGPGDIVGELASLDRQPRRGTLSALGPVEALVVPGNSFVRLLSEYKSVSVAVGRVLSGRLGEADRYRLSASSTGVAPRLAQLLLDLADRYGESTPDGGRWVRLPLTQDDLANCVASSPRSVARILAAWRQAGVVHTGRRLIVLRRPSVLRALTGQPG